MATPDAEVGLKITQKKIVEIAIQLGVLLVLAIWCFEIIRPFVLLLFWAAIVAIALYPVYNRLAGILGQRQKLAATLLVLVLIALLVAPAALLTESLLTGAQALADAGEQGKLQIPAPPASVDDWPVVGKRIYELWSLASTNLPAVLDQFTPQIKLLGAWVLSTVTGTGIGILQFIAAFIIAGVLLVTADKGVRAAKTLATRLAPNRGEEFAQLSTTTIRNVALGIVGISVLQTSMLSVGFLAIGLPGAGLAALAALVLGIVQVGPGLVSLIAIVYAFSALSTGPAVLFTIWTLVMTMSDGALKPLVFGRGGSVPMLVVFIGAIGGMLAYGIIGLFVGAVVLSLGFKLYEAWLDESTENSPSAAPNEPANVADTQALEADYKV